MTPQPPCTRELRVDGIRTVLREAGPANDREAAAFIHGNPGSSADWAGLLDRAGAPCRARGLGPPARQRRRRPLGPVVGRHPPRQFASAVLSDDAAQRLQEPLAARIAHAIHAGEPPAHLDPGTRRPACNCSSARTPRPRRPR
jgi:hypothetical protein